MLFTEDIFRQNEVMMQNIDTTMSMKQSFSYL